LLQEAARYASAPNENWSSTDNQAQQPASELPKREAEPPYQISFENDEPLRRHSSKPELPNEAPLRGEGSLQGAPATQFAPTATENESLADAQPSEMVVSKPNNGDVERIKADAGATDSCALRAVDTFMLHLAAYLEARSGFAETAIDSRLDQREAAPSLGPNTLDASEHELLRDETYSNSPNLGAEAESFAGSPEKPSSAITDDNQDRSVRDALTDHDVRPRPPH
jgi:hypothetical protein